MKFEIYEGRNKKWYWRLKADNGKIIADGGQGYSTSQNARRAVLKLKTMLVKTNVAIIPLETLKKKAAKKKVVKKKAKKKAA